MSALFLGWIAQSLTVTKRIIGNIKILNNYKVFILIHVLELPPHIIQHLLPLNDLYFATQHDCFWARKCKTYDNQG